MEHLAQILSYVSIVNIVATWIVYRVAIALYNISPFHPLYAFPGPKLAAMGYFYEAYFDFWLVGRYGHEIERMHKKYGPIVRINADELHCNDPNFLDEIYAGGNRVRDKWQHFLNSSPGGPFSTSVFSSVAHETHRMRRSAMARYFSRAQMLKLEGEVHDFTQYTCDKMLRTREPFDVKEAFSCYSADIILHFIDQDGWEPNLGTWVKPAFSLAYMHRHFALARAFLKIAPLFADYLDEGMKAIQKELTVNIPRHIQRALENRENGRVFAELIESNQLPESEKTTFRLTGEGFNLMTAGTETTASALTCITYYLLAQPAMLSRLVKDLQGVDPTNLKWAELEQIPYLWAIIHEALRLMPGLSGRSARIAREENLIYKNEAGEVRWVIPKGTPVAMTSVTLHHDETLFPNPKEFIAERWLLKNGQPNHALEKKLMAFSRGSRSCLGINLAYCELFLFTAAMALRVLPKAQLYKTTLDDIQYDYDLVVPRAKKGTVSVRIMNP